MRRKGELAHTSRAHSRQCNRLEVHGMAHKCMHVLRSLDLHGVCPRPRPLYTKISLKPLHLVLLHVDVYAPEPPSQDNIAVASQHPRSQLGISIDGERYRTMFYEARVGEAAPVGETVAPASEVGADQEKLDELRSLIQGHRAI